MHVDAERFPLAADLMEDVDDVGDTALEEDLDDDGFRDFDDADVVEWAGDDERAAEEDRDDDLRLESLDTIGCIALVVPAVGPMVERRRLFVKGELAGSSASKSKSSMAGPSAQGLTSSVSDAVHIP